MGLKGLRRNGTAMGITDMGPVILQPGGWGTLESFYGKVGNTTATFRQPGGVRIKVRYGFRWLGWDSQSQTMDGQHNKSLNVSGWVGRARMQARMSQECALLGSNHRGPWRLIEQAVLSKSQKTSPFSPYGGHDGS